MRKYLLKNIRIVSSLASAIILTTISCGISLVNFTWEAGRPIKMAKNKKMEKDCKFHPKSMYIKVSFLMGKRTVQV
jgi:hypothetical protein